MLLVCNLLNHSTHIPHLNKHLNLQKQNKDGEKKEAIS